MKLAHDVLDQFLLTLWHVFPWLAGMGVVFRVLSRLSPCNKGKDWWEKEAGSVHRLTMLPIGCSPPSSACAYMRIWVTR